MLLKENNKLIAEFMGIKLNGGGKSIFDEEHFHLFRKTEYEKDGLCSHCHNHVNHGRNIDCYVIDTDLLEYHKSWDALMPVVEKIESMEYNVICSSMSIVEGWHCSIAPYDQRWKGTDDIEETKIEAVYKSIVTTIKWLNENA